MDVALVEARRSLDHGDVPVGAVILVDGLVVASRHNERELAGDPTAHAEILALRGTARALGEVAADGGDPGGHARAMPNVRRGISGGPGRPTGLRRQRPPFRGLRHPLLASVATPVASTHELPITPGVRAAEAATLLTSFFAERRGG